MELVVATKNKKKFAEIKEILKLAPYEETNQEEDEPNEKGEE